MNVKEFKRFIANIPEEFDEDALDFVEVSYHFDSLQCKEDKGRVTISWWGGEEHVYLKCKFSYEEGDIVKTISLGESEANLEE